MRFRQLRFSPPSTEQRLKWGFPKIRGTFLGVPMIRIIVYWGLQWGPLFWESTERMITGGRVLPLAVTFMTASSCGSKVGSFVVSEVWIPDNCRILAAATVVV